MFDTLIFLSALFFCSEFSEIPASGWLLTEIIKAGQIEERADQKKAFALIPKMESVHSAPVMESF